MANKQTGLINRHYIATFLLFLVVLLLACTKGKEGPSAAVPADCQQFLDKYFDAWKSKDIATLQALSFYLSPQDQSRLPEGSLELWRASKNKLVTENFEQVTRDFGDFKGYEVLRVKTATISPQDELAADTIGSGIHTELVCKARFSKKRDAHVGLHLIKQTEGSQYIVFFFSLRVGWLPTPLPDPMDSLVVNVVLTLRRRSPVNACPMKELPILKKGTRI